MLLNVGATREEKKSNLDRDQDGHHESAGREPVGRVELWRGFTATTKALGAREEPYSQDGEDVITHESAAREGRTEISGSSGRGMEEYMSCYFQIQTFAHMLPPE